MLSIATIQEFQSYKATSLEERAADRWLTLFLGKLMRVASVIPKQVGKYGSKNAGIVEQWAVSRAQDKVTFRTRGMLLEFVLIFSLYC